MKALQTPPTRPQPHPARRLLHQWQRLVAALLLSTSYCRHVRHMAAVVPYCHPPTAWRAGKARTSTGKGGAGKRLKPKAKDGDVQGKKAVKTEAKGEQRGHGRGVKLA